MHAPYLFLIYATLLVVGCNTKGSGHPPDPLAMDEDFALVVDESFANRVNAVLPLSGGHLVAVSVAEAQSNKEALTWKGSLRFIDTADAMTVATFRPSSEETTIEEVHETVDGNVLALMLTDNPDWPFTYSVALAAIDRAGMQIAQSELQPVIADMNKCYLQDHLILTEQSVSVTHADGTMFVAMAMCGEVIVMEVAQDLTIARQQAIVPGMPTNPLYTQVSLVAGEDRLFLAVGIKNEDIAFVAEHFGIASPSQEKSSTLIVSIDSKTFDARASIHSTPFDAATPKLAVSSLEDSPKLFLANMISVPRAEPLGGSSDDEDFTLTAFDADTLQVIKNKTVNFDNGEWISSVVAHPTGGVVVGGLTGRVVVDTGSTVRFGKGFWAAFDEDLELSSSHFIDTPRHDVVTTVAFGPSGHGDVLYWGGGVDGPITHTADNDPSLKYSRGFVDWAVWSDFANDAPLTKNAL